MTSRYLLIFIITLLVPWKLNVIYSIFRYLKILPIVGVIDNLFQAKVIIVSLLIQYGLPYFYHYYLYANLLDLSLFLHSEVVPYHSHLMPRSELE